MQVTNDRNVVESIQRGAPVPVTPLPASPVKDAIAADRRSRPDERRNPAGSPGRFRSVLDSLTVAGLGQAFTASEPPIASDGISEPRTKVTRSGTPSRDVDGQDSEALLRAARAYASQPKQAEPREGDKSERNEAATVFKHVALTASRRYAQSFFALDRTFASRGETLEVST